jgi:ABC-type nickel/cobalt efflux system permease component RcnA
MEITNLALMLALGFAFGLKHSLDPDHVVAVSTIVSENKSVWKSSVVGVFWGIGHTVMLALVGTAVLAFKITIPEEVALALEFAVGVMLVGLGITVARRIIRERLHLHFHEHGQEKHLHLHSHKAGPHHQHEHRFRREYRSLVIGMVHGMAGSAAVTVLVLSSIRSILHGVLYLLTFGVGSIAGMVIISTLIGSPFAFTAMKFERANRILGAVASIASIGMGALIMYETGFKSGWFF